jgi:hypothetical protein
MLQRRHKMLIGGRLKVRRPARLMGTNTFRMKISGTTGERPPITRSRKDSRYIGEGGGNCKQFIAETHAAKP